MNYRITAIILALFFTLGVKANKAEPCYFENTHISFITPSIVRVQWGYGVKQENNNTGVCVYTSQEVKVKNKETKNEIILRSSKLTVICNKYDGSISFRDNKSNEILKQLSHSGEPVYQENVVYDENSAHTEETANGKVTVRDVIRRDTIGKSWRYVASFNSNGEKAVYGLGCQMEDYMNLQGKTVYLTQHNLKVQIPMLVSTNGYGLLFDAGCAMKYTSSQEVKKLRSQEVKELSSQEVKETGGQDYSYTMQLEAAKELDYYFIAGDMNKVVEGYRFLTGDVSMMPRYVFGYTQSKERYVSSADILSTLKEYRRRYVPIDMIVQDWNYWPQGWGYMKMNPKYYPDPKALADSVHQMHAKLMVSIWPNPQGCPEADDFKARGMMLPNDVYDVFNPEARKHYWKYANDEFFSKGFDAWWCDSSEPLDADWNRPPRPEGGIPYGWDSQERRWNLNKDILSESLGAERSSLYSLYHSMGIYENQRAQDANKRVVNLTRSSYAGQQRFGTIVWNGDTHASWQSFRDQIPAGLNYMATGNPYWTVDVGSFFTRDDGHRWFYKGEFPDGVKSDAYKEYYVRMFQWATFLPMLRSHGSDTPREIWQFITEEEKLSNCKLADCKYAGAILKMINFRYSHIPYIYSMAAMQSGLISLPMGEGRGETGYTMARPLAFDFSNDDNVLDLKDEYMFGNYLVCPVTHPISETTTRKVYLPEGTIWIDYWTSKRYEGGQYIVTETTIDQLPLFVKQGSVIPTTEVAEYTDAQVGKPITINVYPGEDAEFTLYEDEGDNYNYEKGAYSQIPMYWNDKKHTLTIGNRNGSFKGMLTSRQFNIHVVGNASSDQQINYSGKETKIKF